LDEEEEPPPHPDKKVAMAAIIVNSDLRIAELSSGQRKTKRELRADCKCLES